MAIKKYSENKVGEVLNKVETYSFSSDEMFGYEQDEEMKIALASEFADAVVARNTVDNLTSTDTDKALSANQGKILKDAQDVLNGDVATEGSVLKDIKDNAEDATFTDTSGLDSTTIANAINEIYAEKATANGLASLDATGKIPVAQLPTTAMEYKGSWNASSEAYPTTPDAGDFWIVSVAGTTEGEEYDVGDAIIYNGATWDKINKIEIAEEVSLTSDLYTATDVKSALEEIAGSGRTTETVKGNADAIATLEGVVDTNRLYSDQQYLALKAKADSLQVKCNTLQAEVYTDAPILQYGAVEIIGDGYEANDTPIDVSANVVDGSLELEQKGLTITNLVENGDFSSGITGWNSGNSTRSVSSKIMSIIGNGTGVDPKVMQGETLVVGNVYFFVARVRVTNPNCLRIQLRTYATQVAFQLEPAENQWYTIKALFVALSGHIDLRIVHNYADNATANGKVMEVDGNYGVSAYNLTALGLDHITDTDILAKLLPYVDGTQNVGKMGMRVVGKNLFDFSILEDVPGITKTKIAENFFSISGYNTLEVIPQKYFAPDKRYTFSGSAYELNDASNLRLRIVYTDDTTENIFTPTPTETSFSKTSALGKSIKNVSYTYSGDGTTYIRNFQINLGSTALPYEPYQEQLTFLPAIGNSLPNGTADSIKTVADGWEHTKRVSTPVSVASGVAVNTTNYPTAKDGGQWVNELTAGGTEIGVVGTDSTTGAGMLRFELATPITTHYDLPHLTSGKTIHRFAGEEKIALYGTGLTFSENVLTVLSAVKFVAGVMTDITSLATITTNTVTFSGVNATDVVYVKVEHDVDRPLGVLEHTPAVSNTASRLKAIEDWIALQS